MRRSYLLLLLALVQSSLWREALTQDLTPDNCIATFPVSGAPLVPGGVVCMQCVVSGVLVENPSYEVGSMEIVPDSDIATVVDGVLIFYDTRDVFEADDFTTVSCESDDSPTRYQALVFLADVRPPIITGESTINEGGNLSLNCDNRNSNTRPRVEWLDPMGEVVSSDEDLEISPPNTTREIAGTYTCRTLPGQFTGSENSTVEVVVQSLTQDLTPDDCIATFQIPGVPLVPGGVVCMRCVVGGVLVENPTYQVEDTEITPDSDDIATVVDGVLIFFDTRDVFDADAFTSVFCESDDSPRYQAIVFLANVRPPIITGESTINEGGMLSLMCDNTNSNTRPRVEWLDPMGIVVSSDEELEISPPNTTREIAGTYTCRTLPGQFTGSENSTVEVVVRSLTQDLTPTDCIANFSIPGASLVPRGVVCMWCLVSGVLVENPTYEVGSMEIGPDSDDMATVVDGVLIFFDTRDVFDVDDFTSVFCESDDSPRYQALVFLANVRPPIITGESTINEGDMLSLMCDNTNSNTRPRVEWLDPMGEVVSSDDELEISPPDTTREIAGTYTCRTLPGQFTGSENSTVEVVVQYAPEVMADNQDLIEVPVGIGDLQISCTIDGVPPPDTIVWIHNSTITLDSSDPRITIENTTTSTSLTVEGVRREEGGVYTCDAGNVVGNDNAVTSVRIQLPPGPPTNLEVVPNSETTTSLDISWDIPFFDGFSPISGYRVQILVPGRGVDISRMFDASTTQRSLVGLDPLTEYTLRVFAMNEVGLEGESDETMGMTLSLLSVCENGDVRLAGGSDIAGRVEICFDGTWGTVCDDGWDSNDARVVCRQLGLPSSSAMAFQRARFGAGRGPIHLDDVGCSGNESSLQQCFHPGVGVHDCSHFEDASVVCINGTFPPTPHPTSRPQPPSEPCEEDEFRCPNDEYEYCIPRYYICDSVMDCSDGYDEHNCSKIELDGPSEISIVEGIEENLEICLTVTEASDRHIFRQYTIETIPFQEAKYGKDYVANNISVTFNGSYSVGDSECVVANISALEDSLVEGTERFSVLIQPELPSMPVVFIIDKDYLRVGFPETSYTVSESASVIELEVSALADENGNTPSIGIPLGVRITSRDASAEAGRDYQGVLSTVYFRPPYSNVLAVQVKILDDDVQEGEERFTVELSAFDISIVLVNCVAEVVIEDDDISTCPPLLSPANGSVRYSSVDVGSLAEYTCDCGYSLEGVPNRVCRLDYTWSAEEPTCQKTSSDGVCTVDREIVNVNGSTATFSFCGVGSDIVSFICKLDGVILPDCSSPLTNLSPGTYRLRIVPVGCTSNKGKTVRFEV